MASQTQMDKLLILGTNPFADVLRESFSVPGERAFVGYVENRDISRKGQVHLGITIFWDEDIHTMSNTHLLCCSIASTFRSEWIEKKERVGFLFADLIHPTAIFPKSCKYQHGLLIDTGCVLAGFSSFGRHVRIGRAATLGHHLEIGNYCVIHPGAIISGHCRIGEKTIIGAGAVIVDNVEIGEGAFIAAGSVVTRNVKPGALVGGNPARIIRDDYGPK